MYARAKERYCPPSPQPLTCLTLQPVRACQGTLLPPHTPNPTSNIATCMRAPRNVIAPPEVAIPSIKGALHLH